MDTEYDEGFSARNDNQSAQVIQIDNGKHVSAVAICAALAGICASISIWSVMRFTELESRYTSEAEKTGTEYRVLLNHYMELEASVKEMRNGK